MDKIFNKPFAINGARVAIPENGTENERVSFDKGFTQPYEVEAPSVDNPNGQGFNILRPEMNEALYQLSLACNVLAENIDNWIALTTENLNNITQRGRYFQTTQSQATNEKNYPTNETGYLIVLNNNINGYQTTQFYICSSKEKFYIRNKINNSSWGDWVYFVSNTEYTTKISELETLINSSKVRWFFANFNDGSDSFSIVRSSGNFYISKLTANRWKVTHNNGNLNYSVSIMPTNISNTPLSINSAFSKIYIFNIQSDTFDIYMDYTNGQLSNFGISVLFAF